jgi:D-methionine transport system substrate-binding protein
MTVARRTLLALALSAAALSTPLVHAQDKKELTIGATAGSNIEVLRQGIKPLLEKRGYTVKLVEFNDYVQPNIALAQGALDANFFQHITYLNRFREDRGLDIVDVVQGRWRRSGSIRRSARAWPR